MVGAAATMMAFRGSGVATAEVLSLSVTVGDYNHGESWDIGAHTSGCTGPTWILDNGTAIGKSPFEAIRPYCENGGQWMGVQWRPTTVGAHHIVVEQRNTDGTVTSSMSKDVEVKQFPCPLIDSGSAGYIACSVVSGSKF
ncbi:hypothetical protein [Nocardia seriolae]|nr:hypothetical protein [Nocardia seriolae]